MALSEQIEKATAQQVKDSLRYPIFNPLPKDSIPESPTFHSLLHEKPQETISRLLWYRPGPKFGIFIPTQQKLAQHFKSLSYFLTIDLLYSRFDSGLVPGLGFYSISKPLPSGFMSSIYDHAVRDRFTALTPSYGYQYFLTGNSHFITYIEIDAKYIIGELRVRSDKINTGLESSFGAAIESGALVSDHLRIDFSYLFMRPIHGYSLEGLTTSISYLFHSVHTW